LQLKINLFLIKSLSFGCRGDGMEKENNPDEEISEASQQEETWNKTVQNDLRKKYNIKEIGNKALNQIEYLLKKKAQGVVGISREGEYWNVQIEVLERRAVPDVMDILGTYEMKLDMDLNTMEYRRVGLRHRGDMIVQDEC
jgi:hypothetical protein